MRPYSDNSGHTIPNKKAVVVAKPNKGVAIKVNKVVKKTKSKNK